MNLVAFTRKHIDGSIFIFILSIVLFYWTSVSASEPVTEQNFFTTQVTVDEGESLWSIAAENPLNEELTIEQMVQWIKEKNTLDNETIYPGQRIVIPIKMDTLAAQ